MGIGVVRVAKLLQSFVQARLGNARLHGREGGLAKLLKQLLLPAFLQQLGVLGDKVAPALHTVDNAVALQF